MLVKKEGRSQGRIAIVHIFWRMATKSETRPAMVAIWLILFAAPAAQYSVNIVLSQWTDAAAAGADVADLDATGVYLLRYLLVTAAFATLVALRGLICGVFFVRASRKLHGAMLDAIFAQPMRFFDTTPVGRVLNRFSGDVMLGDIQLPRLFDIWGFIIGSNFTTLRLDDLRAADGARQRRVRRALRLPLPLLHVGRRRPAAAGDGLDLADRRAFSSFLIGLESIRAFSRVGTLTDAFRHKQTQFARAVHALIAIERFTTTIAVTVGVSFFMACLSTTLLLLARYRVFVTPGTAGVTLAYASLISFRIPAMFLMSSALERLLAAVQRILEYTLNLTPEEPPPPKGAAAAAAPPPEWPSDGAVVLKNVTLRYSPELPPVLRGVSLSAAHGERLGLLPSHRRGEAAALCARLPHGARGGLDRQARDRARNGRRPGRRRPRRRAPIGVNRRLPRRLPRGAPLFPTLPSMGRSATPSC